MGINNSILSGLKWTGLERFLNQFIQFALNIIIARLISPEDYGVLGILMVYINVSQVFIECGLGNALICFNKLEKQDLNTTFMFNLVVSVFLVFILFITAPFIESYFAFQELALFIRVSLIVLITNSLIIVPTSILKIKMDFKSLAYSNILSNLISAVIGVAIAYHGGGVWALIAQLLSKSIIQAVLITIQSKWLPNFIFYRNSFLKLYKYGLDLFATNIITKITDEGISFFIAKFYTPTKLGLYTRANQFSVFPSSCFGSIINTVMFPSLSLVKDDTNDFHHLFKKALEVQALFTIPLFLGLAMEAKPLILLLLTDKWAGVIPLLQVLCIGRCLSIVSNFTEQALMANGDSRIFLKQQCAKLLLKIICILIAIPYGIFVIAIADSVQTFCYFFITNYLARKTVGLSVKKQFTIITPFLLSAIIGGFTGYILLSVIDNLYIELCLPCIVALTIYVLLIKFIFKCQCLNLVTNRLWRLK